MLRKIKRIMNLIFRICLAIFLIIFMITTIGTLLIQDLRLNTDVMSIISLTMVLLSLPGIIDSLADEYNPKRKKVRLSCKCPNCRHLIEMDVETK
ncbi:hypothetical protein ACTHO0_24755 [Cytobacillus praedii]|uniref:hypothetical protein n=1 Tax=Cytobacillus praedii TaxID=1742358 RepID=UPI003F7FF95C